MDLLKEELYRSFMFFLEEGNHDINSPGYGLILDNTKNKNMASIASVGFGLSAYVIGVENRYITYEKGEELVKNTFKTFLNNLESFNGFYPHFFDISTGKSYKKCEYSTIDTVIFFNGAITCDSYFDSAEIHQLFDALYSKLNFKPFLKEYHEHLVVSMAYNPNVGGDYRGENDSPWIYQWHMFAEQLSMYFLAAGTDSLTASESKRLFNDFERKTGQYNDYKYVYCPTNALFVYQYSHAWIDFRDLDTKDHINWYENSKIATLANKAFCVDHAKDYPIFSENIWGATACLTPNGYRNQCVIPNDFPDPYEKMIGVFAPSAPFGSLPFASDEVLGVVKELKKNYMSAFKKYGFTDSITIDNQKLWIAEDYIGINKGITVLMIDNYLNGTTWKYYMKHKVIQKAIKKLEFLRK